MELAQKVENSKDPKTVEEAEALIRDVESLCMSWDVDGMAAGFTEDCIARFGLLPEMHVRAAIREFFRKRSERQKNFGSRSGNCGDGKLAVWEAASNIGAKDGAPDLATVQFLARSCSRSRERKLLRCLR
jgi:hypothetical protein